ncbi:hypothetical protein CBL_06443 [Carabus blaptoides fortunei]
MCFLKVGKCNIPAKNYVEEAEIPEDRYVYCDECMHEHLDSCKEHMLIEVHDNSVPANENNSNRARDTLPHGWFEVKECKIKDGGYGIWALRKIPKGFQFGPDEGVAGVVHDGIVGRLRRMVHPFPEKVFKCENCYLIFCSPTYLEEHVARCTKIMRQ